MEGITLTGLLCALESFIQCFSTRGSVTFFYKLLCCIAKHDSLATLCNSLHHLPSIIYDTGYNDKFWLGCIFQVTVLYQERSIARQMQCEEDYDGGIGMLTFRVVHTRESHTPALFGEFFDSMVDAFNWKSTDRGFSCSVLPKQTSIKQKQPDVLVRSLFIGAVHRTITFVSITKGYVN